MTLRLLIVATALALCAACNPGTENEAIACADGGAVLPVSGLCQAEAQALIQMAPGSEAESFPAGCEAVVNETELPANQVLLYRAARCDGRTTTLAFAGGAHSASISVAQSGLPGDPTQDLEVIRLFGVDPDPRGALRAEIAALPAAERAMCEIRPAGVEGWPSDALVIAPTIVSRARMPHDEPISACGPLGLDEDSVSYWRLSQGFAWHFDLGQESRGFDPASVTVIERDAAEAWRAAP